MSGKLRGLFVDLLAGSATLSFVNSRKKTPLCLRSPASSKASLPKHARHVTDFSTRGPSLISNISNCIMNHQTRIVAFSFLIGKHNVCMYVHTSSRLDIVLQCNGHESVMIFISLPPFNADALNNKVFISRKPHAVQPHFPNHP